MAKTAHYYTQFIDNGIYHIYNRTVNKKPMFASQDEKYVQELACYIHTNAQKHHLVEDFREWKWTSYHRIISDSPTKLAKEALISHFGDIDNLVYCHTQYAHKIEAIKKDFIIEDV